MFLFWYLFVINYNYIVVLLGYLWVVSSHNYFVDPVFLCAFVPIKSYSNVETEKGQIIKENENKAGIYLFTNLTNGKRYIGSSDNLKRRFLQYLSNYYLLTHKSMPICLGLLKHGYSNFSLAILEYCKISDLLIREKHHCNLLQPEYNIALDPGAPFLGRKHTEESRQRMSDAKKGENNPMHGKTGEASPLFGKKLSDETKKKISGALAGENHPMYGKPKPEGAGMPPQAIEVFDNKKNKITIYESIRAAARDLDVDMSRITKYFRRNQQKPYKGRYTFKKL